MKKFIYIFLALFLFSCEKEVDSNNPNSSVNSNDCNCGIVISVEHDASISGGYMQNQYDVKARNECSDNIQEFTQVPDNGDYVPEEGENWCRNNSW